MTPHELDRPAWASLTSRHAGFAEGDTRARRYRPAIVPFAASADDSPESLSALGALLKPGETAVLLQAGAIRLPASLRASRRAEGVQMLASGSFAPFEDERIMQLGPADAADMLALARLTEPGPFSLKALDIGRFWGVRENGRLVAMAGERMGPARLRGGQRRLHPSRRPWPRPRTPALALCRGPHRGSRRPALPARLRHQHSRHPPLRIDRLCSAQDDAGGGDRAG